ADEAGSTRGPDERGLVPQQRGHRRHPEPVEPPEAGHEAEGDESGDGEEMADPRTPQGGGDTEAGGKGVEARAAVEVDVLTRVNQVEARDPYGKGEPEHEGWRLEGAAHGDPASRSSDAVGEAKDPVRGPGEAFGVRVADEEQRRPGRESKAERIQHPGGHGEED